MPYIERDPYFWQDLYVFPSMTSQCYNSVPTLCRLSTFSWVKTCRYMWMISLMPWPFHLQGRPQCPAGWDLLPAGTGMQTTIHPAHSLFTTHTTLFQSQLYLISIDHQAPLSSCNWLLLRFRYSPQHPQSLSFHYCEAHTKQQVTGQFCVFQSPYSDSKQKTQWSELNCRNHLSNSGHSNKLSMCALLICYHSQIPGQYHIF
jgi:hypothetical protein